MLRLMTVTGVRVLLAGTIEPKLFAAKDFEVLPGGVLRLRDGYHTTFAPGAWLMVQLELVDTPPEDKFSE